MAGQDLPADVLSEVNAHVAELRPQILQVALQVLDGVDVAVVADRSLDAMDENQDGKVTRDEFLSLFISVMTEVRGVAVGWGELGGSAWSGVRGGGAGFACAVNCVLERRGWHRTGHRPRCVARVVHHAPVPLLALARCSIHNSSLARSSRLWGWSRRDSGIVYA